MNSNRLHATKIILVDGMPGTRKSTASQFIYRQLCAIGLPAYWCHEERAVHPVRLFYERNRHPSWAEYSEEAVSLWQDYAQELLTGNQIAVVDAAVLQNHARAMLLYGCDWPPILNLVRSIESLLAPLEPIWIYLKPPEVESHFRNLIEVRGRRLLELWLQNQDQFPYAHKIRETGLPGFIAFWREFGELADRVFDELTIDKLRQVVTQNDGGVHRRAMLDFLVLPIPSESSNTTALERFAGDYVPFDDPSALTFVLQARDYCLIMSCSEPSIDVQRGPIGCYLEVRLIPSGKNRFYVETWPHEVEFREDGMGTIVSMRMSTPEDGWGQASRVFVRRCPPADNATR